MKNWEKYEEKIKKFGAIALVDDEVKKCERKGCHECEFNPDNHAFRSGDNCQVVKVNWLYEECEEPEPTLTLKEKHFLECVRDEKGYIARDEDGMLELYGIKPLKGEHEWLKGFKWERSARLDKYIFEFITWEDDKPWSVGELLKLEVENDE